MLANSFSHILLIYLPSEHIQKSYFYLKFYNYTIIIRVNEN